MGLLARNSSVMQVLHLLLLVLVQVHGHPDGAPNCYARPRHGFSKVTRDATVKYIGSNQWQVLVPHTHKGISLGTRFGGVWYILPGSRGYKSLGSCITHSNNQKKTFSTFIFRGNYRGEPEFSGYLVYDYNNYARLRSYIEPYNQSVTLRLN